MEFIGHIESIFDAFIVCEAARNGEVVMLNQRQSPIKYYNIVEGSTVIYDETLTKMKRWTDGRTWSPSKLSNGFFIYEEKLEASESSRYLIKKVLKVVTPDNHRVHVINYTYSDSDLSKMLRPIHCNFKNYNKIMESAKLCRYYKCYRSKSVAWRKLFFAPELEHEVRLSMMTSPKSAIFPSFEMISSSHNYETNTGATKQESPNNHSIILPPIHELLNHNHKGLVDSNNFASRHSETVRMLSILDKSF